MKKIFAYVVEINTTLKTVVFYNIEKKQAILWKNIILKCIMQFPLEVL